MTKIKAEKIKTPKDLRELCRALRKVDAPFLERRKHRIFICTGGGCLASGALKIKKAFEEVFGVGNVEVETYGNVLTATCQVFLTLDKTKNFCVNTLVYIFYPTTTILYICSFYPLPI